MGTKIKITDKYNRLRWWGFQSQNNETEFMVLIDKCLYENGSETVYVPLLDLTYQSDKPFIARWNAEEAIEKYLLNQYGKVYDSEHKFETIAYCKETVAIKTF